MPSLPDSWPDSGTRPLLAIRLSPRRPRQDTSRLETRMAVSLVGAGRRRHPRGGEGRGPVSVLEEGPAGIEEFYPWHSAKALLPGLAVVEHELRGRNTTRQGQKRERFLRLSIMYG